MASRTSIDARISAGGGHAQSTEVVRPAPGVTGALGGVGKPGVGHAHQSAAVPVQKVDLDETRARWHLVVSLPAETIGEAMDRDDLAELPARGAAGAPGDVLDEIESARMIARWTAGTEPASPGVQASE